MTVFAFVLTLGVVQASADEKGYNNSYNWLRDDDGDGIPNCLDDDWVRPLDGTGYMLGKGCDVAFVVILTAASGDKNQHRNQLRYNKPEDPGDHLEAQFRKRDQTGK